MKQFKKFQKDPKTTLFAGMMVLGITILVISQLTESFRTTDVFDYSTFIEKVEKHQVKSVMVDRQDVSGYLQNSQRFETTIPSQFNDWELLRKNGVEIRVESTAGGNAVWYLLMLGFLGVFIGIAVMLFRQARNTNAGGNVFSMGKSKARMFLPQQIKTRFIDVAGVTEAKEDLADIIDYLRHPEKYRRMGAKLTRGVLLVGEPGNGKTLLARAVAGEANCAFFSISGSDFIEVFVGVGAARVRDLFTQARKHSPCIVFIDEIDAVGRQRGGGLGGGNDEREQTLNQLLTEMDGFDEDAPPIVVLAATNRADVLDKALLRPGRFDRQVQVPFPDLASREQILKVHMRGVKVDPTIDIHKLARGTAGFSGADLANLVNEAAINASKHNREQVLIQDFEEARDRALIGKELKTIALSEEERTLTAYHEAGHAVVNLMLPKLTDPLYKVTIVPRGGALGVTHSIPEREKYSHTKDQMLALIMKMLGGRVAEELIFNEVATGAASDFKAASNVARAMVCQYGMSDAVGPIAYTQNHSEFRYSEHTADMIDSEVRRIIDECYAQARSILEENRDKLEKLAQALLEKETMDAKEIYELLGMESREQHQLR